MTTEQKNSDTSPVSASIPRPAREFLRRMAFYLRPYKRKAAADILCALLSLGFYFLFPQVTQYIIDDVIAGRKVALLPPAILGLLAAFLLCDLFNALRISINTSFEQAVAYDMRRDI